MGLLGVVLLQGVSLGLGLRRLVRLVLLVVVRLVLVPLVLLQQSDQRILHLPPVGVVLALTRRRSRSSNPRPRRSSSSSSLSRPSRLSSLMHLQSRKRLHNFRHGT